MKKRTLFLISVLLIFTFLVSGGVSRAAKVSPLWIGDIVATPEFTGSESDAYQVLQLKVSNRTNEPVAGIHITMKSDSIAASKDAVLDLGPNESKQASIGFRAKPGMAEGTKISVNVSAETPDGLRVFRVETVAVSRADWKLFFIPGFHFDPEWWNTQFNYLESFNENKQRGAFDLIKAYLEMTRTDPDYKFVLEAIPYLKPYWDMYPEDRDYLRQLIKDGRLELMGGSYNEPQSTLVSGEANIRNLIYGIAYMRGVWGGDPETSWQCDVFGHTPNWPQFNLKAGLTGSSWARGPYHRASIDRDKVNFPQDFYWVAPDGSRLLTSFMSCFYGCGRKIGDNPADAESEIRNLFLDQKKNALTPNILLPMSQDFILPGKDIGEIARKWNAKHISPKVHVATVKEFFDSMRGDAKKDNVRFPDVSRDMNPVFKGCAVSFIDQKQANREIENRITAAESFSTVAAMFGAKYPSRALDKAWRELLFFSHHDGITGSESDQVYLDLSNSLREAYELSGDVLNRATDFIGTRVKSESFKNPVAVFNPLAWARRDAAIFTVAPDKMLSIKDAAGKPVPAQKIAPDRVAAMVSVPAMGYAIFDVQTIPASKTVAPSIAKAPVTIQNEFYKLTVDPAKGGAMTSLVDVRTGKEYLKTDMKSLGNDLAAYKEYASLPNMGEGPWSMIPTGERYYSHDFPATVKVEIGPAFSRIIVTGPFKHSSREQRITLYKGADRVDFETRVIGYNDSDWLYRVQFPASVSGGRPVYEVANAAVARPYTFDVDTKQQKWLVENAAYNWLDLTVPLRLEVRNESGVKASRSLGIGEIVLPDTAGTSIDEIAYKLVATLVKKTVTTTPTRASKRRYGDINLDSNLPDFRITVGPIADNVYTEQVVSDLPNEDAVKLSKAASSGPAVLWIDKRTDGVPVLIVAGPDASAAAHALEGINDGIAASGMLALTSGEFLDDTMQSVDSGGFTLINYGNPSAGVLDDGQIMLDLFRSSSAWPSGVWMDPPQRKVPDGSNFEFNHWPHVFRYSIRLHSGDWRKAATPRAGYEANFPLIVRPLTVHSGELPAQMSFVSVSPENFVITALKTAGFAEASFKKKSETKSENLIMRLFDAAGTGGVAVVKFFKPLSNAWKTNLLEVRQDNLATDGQTARVPSGPFSTETLGVAVKNESPESNKPQVIGREIEPFQPVAARWWRYNIGEAPLGFLPLSLHFTPDSVTVKVGQAAQAKLAVASSYIDAVSKGDVVFEAPAGLKVSLPKVGYNIPANGYAEYSLMVSADGGIKSGVYHVRAILTEPSGQKVEDVLAVQVGTGLMSLEGDWKFKTGMNNKWSNSDFDDSKWGTMPLPGIWNKNGVADFIGYGWYRRSFDVSAEWKNKPLIIIFKNGVDDYCDVFFNGKQVGGSDQKQVHRHFEVNVPQEVIKYGGKNQITIRVYNSMGEGGIGGPVIMGTNSELGAMFDAKPEAMKVKVAHGGKGKIALRVNNYINEQLRGEVWLTSPYEAWPLFEKHRVSFSAPPLGSVTIEYPVTVPADFTPGAYWAIFKVTANEKFIFSDTVTVEVGK